MLNDKYLIPNLDTSKIVGIFPKKYLIEFYSSYDIKIKTAKGFITKPSEVEIFNLLETYKDEKFYNNNLYSSIEYFIIKEYYETHLTQ